MKLLIFVPLFIIIAALAKDGKPGKIEKDKIGEVRLKMDIDEALKKFQGMKIRPDSTEEYDDDQSPAGYYVFTSPATWIKIDYFEDRKVTSISTNDSGFSTPTGIRPGTSIAYVFEREKNLEIEEFDDDLIIYLPDFHMHLYSSSLKGISKKIPRSSLDDFFLSKDLKYLKKLKPETIRFEELKMFIFQDD